MKSAAPGPGTSLVERFPHGFWLFIGERELFVPFTQFPWFREASVRGITNVQLLNQARSNALKASVRQSPLVPSDDSERRRRRSNPFRSRVVDYSFRARGSSVLISDMSSRPL
jgi:hypothetical protein